MQEKHDQNKNREKHIPVLLEAVITYLSPKKDETYLDLTAGYGGHSSRVLGKTFNYSCSVLVDRDNDAIDHLNQIFAGKGTRIVKNDFATVCAELIEEGQKFDMVLADLGVSSLHLDNASRGFSLKADGPLDMRMDKDMPITAGHIVNSYSEEELADLIYRYGEEPKSRQIARLIVNNRPFSKTTELAETIAQSAVYRGYSKRHPATKTFQALRIAVNDELKQLEVALPLMVALLKPRGRLGIISFHSLEDRIVKDFFAEHSGDRFDASLQLLTKQPIVADEDEIVINPRSRSAKLRVVAKK